MWLQGVLTRDAFLQHRGLILGAAVVATGGCVFWCLRKRKQLQHFEFGSVDLSEMSKEAIKKLKAQSAEARTSLIPEALLDLEEQAMLGSDAMAPAQEVDRRAAALQAVGAPAFRRFLQQKGAPELRRTPCRTLQLNIGLYCNQACNHCHVESSPLRKEMMSDSIIERCLFLLEQSPTVQVLDLTGGAPELNNGFRRLVEGAAKLRDSGARPGLRIIDRCNLTVLVEPGQEDLVDFLVQHKVDVIASLPSYDAAQTDQQRGRKVFERSIQGLRMLNARGYGTSRGGKSKGLRLDLVFNPPGPFLPPRQNELEAKYRTELSKIHGVEFDQLITITNMPIKRFFDFLRKKGTLEAYMDLLVRNFNVETVPKVMCTDTVSVGWDGQLYDCDFNQQLDLKIGRQRLTVFDINHLDDPRLSAEPIVTAAHCFGCTAAQGSSCQGALQQAT